MEDRVLAAVRMGPSRIELQEFPMPDVPDDGALLRMEVAGICGTDVKMYKAPRVTEPVIMGHENVGVIARAGRQFMELKGVGEGDRVFVEHYVGCFNCEWCHLGQYRHCWATDWRNNPEALRYGYTAAARPPHLWGGFAEYLYLPWNAVLHHVPDSVSAGLAGIATPLSNGIEWALFDCEVGFNSSVLIQGPGQQGLAQVVACKQAGASTIVITGTSKDEARMDVAKVLGADFTIDIEQEDTLARVAEITRGDGVDVVIDCTSGAGTAPILVGIQALKRRGGMLLIQGELDEFSRFPIRELTEKAITIKSARGHSYRACELALEQLASKRFPLDLLTTHTFGLDEVDIAIRSVGGEREPGVIHVSLHPGRVRSGPAGS